MAPKKSAKAVVKDPKQSSILKFVTPSKKRKEVDPEPESPSSKRPKRCATPIENNNNNEDNNNEKPTSPKDKKKNNNNNEKPKSSKDKKKKAESNNKENTTVKSTPKGKKKSASAASSPTKASSPAKKRGRPSKAKAKANAETVENEAAVDQPSEILGLPESTQNEVFNEAEILANIIDHGAQEDGEVEPVEEEGDSDSPDVIAEESDDDDYDMGDDSRGLIDSNGVVELSPTTATVLNQDGTPSDLFASPPLRGETSSQRLSSGTPPERRIQPFKCKKCDQLFRNRYYMRKHMLMDHENQLYKCRICAFTSVFPEKLKSHIIKQHVCKKEKSEALSVQTLKNENEVFELQMPRKIIMIDGVPLGKVKKVPQCYICDVCGRVYSSKFSLERHVRCHTGERPYQCDVCDFTTSYREHMQRHMTSVHLVVHSDEPKKKYIPKNRRPKAEREAMEKAQAEEDELGADGSPVKKRRNILRKRFECAACGMRATHKSDLVEHIKEKHPKAHIVSLDNNDGSKVHLVVTASKKPRESRKFTATCSYCSKVFHDNWKYMVHLRSHTGVKPFSCSECDFHATTKMTVRDHIHRKHPTCPDAKLILKLVNITDGSVEEVAIDVPQKEFKCELCFTVFPGNYELKTHKFKDHPEAKPFSCTMCEHKEWGKSAIVIHCSEAHPDFDVETIILRNGRPTKIGPINLPKCDTCNKQFPYQSLLYLHQRTHTGERNYGCDSCDFRTDSKMALTRHILKKHLENNNKAAKGGKRKSSAKKTTKDMATSTSTEDIDGPEEEATQENGSDDAAAAEAETA